MRITKLQRKLVAPVYGVQLTKETREPWLPNGGADSGGH